MSKFVPSRHLFLTGFMGSGKTTVGKRLAYQLGLPFLDLDAEIVASTGLQISEIFRRDGEAAFRIIERETLRLVSSRSTASVVATGGGVVLTAENVALMHSFGLIINLQVDYAAIAQRLVGDQSRPLLIDQDQVAICKMMNERAAAYADADLVLMTANMSPQQIVVEIVNWLNL